MRVEPHSQIGHQRWLEFRNDSGLEVPAHGVMTVYGTEVINGRVVLLCRDNAVTEDCYPDDRIVGEWFNAFNSQTPVPAGTFGTCTQDLPAIGRWDLDEPSLPTNGVFVGPKAGFHLGFGFASELSGIYAGWFAYGEPKDGRLLVGGIQLFEFFEGVVS